MTKPAVSRSSCPAAQSSDSATVTPPLPPAVDSLDSNNDSSGDLRPISLVERLAKTHCIWLLTQMSRAGAVHLLKDRETGVSQLVCVCVCVCVCVVVCVFVYVCVCV